MLFKKLIVYTLLVVLFIGCKSKSKINHKVVTIDSENVKWDIEDWFEIWTESMGNKVP